MAGNYSFYITTPANTAKADSLQTELILAPGIIEEISIGFPPGCSGLAHIQIYEREFLLFPQNKEGSYAWDSYIYSFNPMYILEEKYPILSARTWNLDEFYEHSLTLMINIIGVNSSINDLIQLSALLRGT